MAGNVKEKEKRAFAPMLEEKDFSINYMTCAIDNNKIADYKKDEKKGKSIKTSHPEQGIKKEILSTELETRVTIKAESNNKEEKEI